jgi:hypothetical protein
LRKCASALLNVRGERAPCTSGEGEYCAGAVLGVAHGDYVPDVADFDDHTIWTAVAPDEVFTARTYATRRGYEQQPG